MKPIPFPIPIPFPGRALAALLALALPLPALADDLEDLNQAIEDYNDGDYDESASLFYQIVEQSSVEDIRLKAEYYLAQSFFRMKLFQAALYYYGTILKAGPTHPYYFKSTEGLVNVSEALDDDLIIPSLLNKEYNPEFAKLPPEVLNKINYIIGQISYRSDKFDEAKSFLDAVPRESSYYGRAQYVLGIINVRRGKAEKAIEIFQGIRELESDERTTYYRLKDLHDLATLGIARTYYGLGQYDKASEAFSKIARFTEYWDDAIFEGSWADFMNDESGDALGRLHTLHSPILASAFSPESWILKSTIYYQSCLYDEAKAALTAFEKSYSPMAEALKPLMEAGKDLEFYFGIIAGKGKEAPPEAKQVPPAVRAYILKNKRMSSFKRYVAHLDDEKVEVQGVKHWRTLPMSQELVALLDQQRQILIQVAGKFVKLRLAEVVGTISGFEGQAEIIRFETSKAEKEALEAGLNLGETLIGQPLYRPKVPRGSHEYWSFDGEFWADELGYYRYTLKNGCFEKKEE